MRKLDKCVKVWYTACTNQGSDPLFLYLQNSMQNQHQRSHGRFGSPMHRALFGATFGILAFGWYTSLAAQEPPETREGRFFRATVQEVEGNDQNSADGEVRTDTLTAAPLTADFSLNVVALNWPKTLLQLPSDTLEIRGASQGTWTAWIPVEHLRDMPDAALPNPGRGYSEPVFFADADQLQVRFRGTLAETTTGDFQHMELVYFDTRDARRKMHSFLESLFSFVRARAEGTVPLVTRAEWGADEQYRFTADGKELWVPEYLQIQKFILHHTAGSDGGTDPAATVRGIYYFHAVVLRWGDIGYNFLIDPAGTVYEGRAGGDGVVGGHTYDSNNDLNYNRGSVGIALLGNYEQDGSVPSAAMQESLTSLLAEKNRLHNISPTGSSDFLNGVIPNIVGHGDVDATLCPGKNTRALIESFRQTAQTKLTALGPLPAQQFSAALESQNVVETTLNKGTTGAVDVVYRNTGNTPWQHYLPNQAVKIVAVGTEGDSKVRSAQWNSATVVGSSVEPNIPAGEIGHFSVPITAPSDVFAVTQQFALAAPDGNELPDTRFSVTVKVSGLDYAAALDTSGVPLTAFVRDRRTVTVRVTNIGVKTWQAGEVRLHLYDQNSAPSRFRAASWQEGSGAFRLDQPTLGPGEQGTFTVSLAAPVVPGAYRHTLALRQVDGKTFVAETPSLTTRVDSHWQAKFLSSSLKPAVARSWQPKAVFTFRNTGAATWTRSFRLKVYGEGTKKSAFRHPSWSNATADVQLVERQVKRGEIGTFIVKLKPPAKLGTYRHTLQLFVKGSKEVVQGGTASLVTRVD